MNKKEVKFIAYNCFIAGKNDVWDSQFDELFEDE